MNSRTLRRRYDALLARLAGWRGEIDVVFDEMARDRSVWPSSGALGERTSGHNTVLDTWCETHNRDVALCKAHGLECRGRPIPTISDPTGEAAAGVLTPSPLHVEMERTLEAMEAVTDRWAALMGAHRRREAEGTRPDKGEPGCELCARVDVNGRPLWEPPEVESSTVGGVLERGYRLCHWCRMFTQRHGHKPSQAQCRWHWEGRRVTTEGCTGCEQREAREAKDADIMGALADALRPTGDQS